ncbi:MAG: type II toxin-antitoxin system RelE/ParE family toxin [Planctomycetia bacterium]|nr:type II toxin-antitoxin system RelE/ParE family toxin [Planctomycetia bacterium]
MREIHNYIARDKKNAAANWVRKFQRKAQSLSYLPMRYEVVPEADSINRPWRHLGFGPYRIIYRVDGNRVRILRVIHGARLLDQEFFERLDRHGD